MAERMVIDASVAAKWFLRDNRESDIDLAEDLLLALLANDLEMHAPRVFTYEVCGLLAKACRTRNPHTKASRMEKDDAIECVRRLFSLPIHYGEATLEEGVESLALAAEYDKSLYDMTYVRMAQEIDSHWCTADEKVVLAMPPDFPSSRILLLSDLRD